MELKKKRLNNFSLFLIWRLFMDYDYWEDKPDISRYNVKSRFAVKCCKYIKSLDIGIDLLDIGAGLGRDSFYFDRLGYNVTASDISMIAEKKFCLNKNIKFVRGDIRNINFGDKKFDIIYSRLGLHYFNDKETTFIFDKIYDLLKPEGCFFIMNKSTDDRSYGEGLEIEEDMFASNDTKHFFSKEYMKEKLHKFEIIDIKKTWSEGSKFIEAIAQKK
jgi:SAM-dependent methyltransferase